MSFFQDGDKTEQPTAKRLSEAWKKGQFARSPEIQTVFVLTGGLLALQFTGGDLWRSLWESMATVLGGLHTIPVTMDSLQSYALAGAFVALKCVGPIVGTVIVAGLLAGALQSRFRASPEATEANWGRLNPIPGFMRIFSFAGTVAALTSMVKLGILILLTYSEIQRVFQDPIFSNPVETAGVAQFLAVSTGRIFYRILGALAVIAAADYLYQFWKFNKDMMMTKDEVKDESKSYEGNQEIKGRRRKMARELLFKKSLLHVPNADVVITNPTHLAIALKYDRKTMKAPKILVKGARLNALKIRELADKNHVPIVENKPLARLLYRYGKPGGEIPAELYLAVAEVLAWVYRTNRYRYYSESNQARSAAITGNHGVTAQALRRN